MSHHNHSESLLPSFASSSIRFSSSSSTTTTTSALKARAKRTLTPGWVTLGYNDELPGPAATSLPAPTSLLKLPSTSTSFSSRQGRADGIGLSSAALHTRGRYHSSASVPPLQPPPSTPLLSKEFPNSPAVIPFVAARLSRLARTVRHQSSFVLRGILVCLCVCVSSAKPTEATNVQRVSGTPARDEGTDPAPAF